MTDIESLKDRLLDEKRAFDRKLSNMPNLTRDQRLAAWNTFLARVRLIANAIYRAESAEGDRYAA